MAYFINIYTKQEKFPSTQANGFCLWIRNVRNEAEGENLTKESFST